MNISWGRFWRLYLFCSSWFWSYSFVITHRSLKHCIMAILDISLNMYSPSYIFFLQINNKKRPKHLFLGLRNCKAIYFMDLSYTLVTSTLRIHFSILNTFLCIKLTEIFVLLIELKKNHIFGECHFQMAFELKLFQWAWDLI